MNNTVLPIIIRRVNLTESSALLNISEQTFMDAFAAINNPADIKAYGDIAFTKQKIEAELNETESEFYFAVLHGEVAGYLKLNSGNAQTEFQDIDGLEVERIYVLSHHQGKKIGESFLNFAVNLAKERGKRYLWLGVFERNENAIRFYDRNGFKPFSSHYFMLGSDKQTDVLLKLDLNYM